MLLHSFIGNLKERYDDGKFCDDIQRTFYLCGT